MGRERKKYEELTIVDDFMFGKVMRHPGRCRRLLELILGVRIRKVVFLDDQETMNPDYAAKGIRMDIYLEDADNTAGYASHDKMLINQVFSVFLSYRAGWQSQDRLPAGSPDSISCAEIFW